MEIRDLADNLKVIQNAQAEEWQINLGGIISEPKVNKNVSESFTKSILLYDTMKLNGYFCDCRFHHITTQSCETNFLRFHKVSGSIV